MTKLADLLANMRGNPKGVSFADLVWICRQYFGEPRQSGSHLIFRTPWPGDPRINIQPGSDSKAKPYQVRQVLAAIEKLKSMRHD